MGSAGSSLGPIGSAVMGSAAVGSAAAAAGGIALLIQQLQQPH
ncbi:hypothetical protein [Nocardia heshunensis]